MALQGDTLWVADIDVVRGFHRSTGMPVRTITIPSQSITLLNDVATGPSGVLYVTDTGIEMTEKGVIKRAGDKVIELRDGRARVRTDATEIGWPNGVTWDAARERWIVVSFDPFGSTMYSLPGAGGPPQAISAGRGRFDGVEVLRDGSILVASWSDYSLHMVSPDGAWTRRLIADLMQPADIGVDTRRNRVAIPQPLRGVVTFYNLPDLALATADR